MNAVTHSDTCATRLQGPCTCGAVSNRTPDDVRAERRNRWHKATHGSGTFGVLNDAGDEVARCNDVAFRDQIIKEHVALKALTAAVGELLTEIDNLGGVEFTKYLEPYKAETVWNDAVARARNTYKQAGAK